MNRSRCFFRLAIVAALYVAILLNANPIVAGEASDNILSLIDNARTLVEDQKFERAYYTLREATIEAWNMRPLTIKNLCFAKSDPEGYGKYIPLDNPSFAQGQKAYIYFEVEGYTIKKIKTGYKSSLSLDLILYNEKGRYVGGRENFPLLDEKTRAPSFERMISLNFDIENKYKSGKYKAEITLHDNISKKEVTKELLFTILPAKNR